MLTDFSKARVLVVGDVMLDSYLYGPTQRISPEAPVPVVDVCSQEARPGGAANVAVNLSGIGAQAGLLGLVGEDDAAADLGRCLKTYGIKSMLVAHKDVQTIRKLRVMSHRQQMLRLDFEETVSPTHVGTLLEAFEKVVSNYDVVILSDYAKGVMRRPRDFIDVARAAGVPAIIDPKKPEFHDYQGAYLLTPNLSGFERVVGHCENEEELLARGEKLRDELGLSALLVTRGEQGMTLFSGGAPPLTISAMAKEVFDVTGAGDTVIATLGASIAAGGQLSDAVRLANVAAGIVVGKVGTATVSVAELHHELSEGTAGTTSGKHCSLDDLVSRRKTAKEAGERVVFTNGCFDLLHPGHVSYLEKARGLGDKLIVAVNSDASVQRLKGNASGAPRPVNDASHRMRMLAALSCVSWVVEFTEDTPAQLIEQVCPDILVKGGDYAPEQIVGRDFVLASGGQVKVLAFEQGYSTTNIIERIRQDSKK